MKLTDLKEMMAMTHKEYDSFSARALRLLRSLPNFNELISLAKDSPYMQDRAQLEAAIRDSIKKVDPLLASQQEIQKGLVHRIKRMLGVE